MKKHILMTFGMILMGTTALADDGLRMTQDDIHVAGPAVATATSPAQLEAIEPAAGGTGASAQQQDLRMTQEDVHVAPPQTAATTATTAPQDIEPAAGGATTEDNLRMTYEDIHHMGNQ